MWITDSRVLKFCIKKHSLHCVCVFAKADVATFRFTFKFLTSTNRIPSPKSSPYYTQNPLGFAEVQDKFSGHFFSFKVKLHGPRFTA